MTGCSPKTPSTGVLSYQPVMAIHQTASAPTFRVARWRRSDFATGIHRFWKAGKGGRWPRPERPGTDCGCREAWSRSARRCSRKPQTVYNLDVAENRDFFVGRQGVLVHDSNFVQPVSDPFDVAAELAVVTPGATTRAR